MSKKLSGSAVWGDFTPATPRSPAQIEAQAHALLAQMSLAEKVQQMAGDTPFFPGALEMLVAYNARPLPAGQNTRLGIPPLRFSDGPRGAVIYHSTCFPVTAARGATWDVDLEARVGDAIGVEIRAQGGNFFGGVCINLLRHPAWGRAQETYGEDPVHLGEMGAALVRGAQRHVMACVKHYAANSIEYTRLKVDVRMSERVLREVYLPHFQRCVAEQPAAVMSAYNQVNGVYCGHHSHLLRDILKGEWGFAGLVMSDFMWGIYDARAAIAGGMDVEMPFTWRFGKLAALVRAGQVAEAWVDEAVVRILRQKLRFAQIGEPERYQPQAVAGAAHRALAREVAQKAIVLLKNEVVAGDARPLLPLDAAHLGRVAVIGKLAAAANIGDHGSSQVRPPTVVTPLAGLRAAGLPVVFNAGRRLRAAARAAQQADVAIVVVGYNHQNEGEHFDFPPKGGDRRSLTLSAHDEALIQAVAAANPRTVVVLIGGGPIITEAWRARVPALLMAWYPGMEGGHALADVLLGRVNPSGRLPAVWPREAAHLPFFDRHAQTIEYDLYHGYRLLERDGHDPAFPFGFGLSYTTFTYSALTLTPAVLAPDAALTVRVTLANTGPVAGAEVAQLYVGCEDAAVDRPRKELRGFARIELAPDETREITFTLPASQLAYYDEARAAWVVAPGAYRVYIGPSADPAGLLTAPFQIVG